MLRWFPDPFFCGFLALLNATLIVYRRCRYTSRIITSLQRHNVSVFTTFCLHRDISDVLWAMASLTMFSDWIQDLIEVSEISNPFPVIFLISLYEFKGDQIHESNEEPLTNVSPRSAWTYDVLQVFYILSPIWTCHAQSPTCHSTADSNK